MQSTKRRKNPEKWRGEAFEDSIEDTVYEGTAAGIMEQLRDLSFDPTEFPDVETYIWFVQNNVIRTTGMDCPLPDGDAETQAAALLRHLDHFGALTMLEV